jgi:hypothetical protein
MDANKRYYSTTKTAEIYDVSVDWLRTRMGSVFIKGVHFVQQSSGGMIRWDFNEMESWWRKDDCIALSSSPHDTLIEKWLQ